MTLIELLFVYADFVYRYGRAEANRELEKIICDKKLIPHVRDSVDNWGRFMSASGEEFKPYKICKE